MFLQETIISTNNLCHDIKCGLQLQSEPQALKIGQISYRLGDSYKTKYWQYPPFT